MGFLDKAKKLAEQAREMAEGAIADAKSRTEATRSEGAGGGAPASPPAANDPRMGTAYVPGMLGRPGWREHHLEDPAAVCPVDERDRAGVPHSTRSQILETDFGTGRRWTAGGKVVGLFYRLYDEQKAWQPPVPALPLPGVEDAMQATLPDGRSLVFFADERYPLVLELEGLDDGARMALARSVADHR